MRAVPPQGPVDRRVGDCEAVVTRHVPHDPARAGVIRPPEMENEVDELGDDDFGMPVGAGLLVDQPASPYRS